MNRSASPHEEIRDPMTFSAPKPDLAHVIGLLLLRDHTRAAEILQREGLDPALLELARLVHHLPNLARNVPLSELAFAVGSESAFRLAARLEALSKFTRAEIPLGSAISERTP